MDEFYVELKAVGANRIAVIQALRETTALTITEAAELLERVPATVKEAFPANKPRPSKRSWPKPEPLPKL